MPGVDGLLHVSEMANYRVANVRDELKEGEQIECPESEIRHQIPARGARLARRDDREYRAYLREEQRSQAGCPARNVLSESLTQGTRSRSSTSIRAARCG
jgi:predicted RNA-binding protein with RPS1 domain